MKHLFTFFLFLISTFANAQTVCDSLDFVSIKYSPFTDSVIVVHVENNNTNEIFDYPGFVLLDVNDDTVAVETVNYFGIGAESVHSLEVRSGMHDPLNNFEGTLQLYSDFYNTFECEWNLNQSLCADEPCDSVILGFQNLGGALVTGDFEWRVEDDNAALVDSGSFTMTANEQYWFYGLCLEPGNYTYSITALTQPSGGGPTLTVSTSAAFASPTMSEPLDWFNDPVAEVAFPFFEFCMEEPNSIGHLLPETPDVKIYRQAGSLVVGSEVMIQQIELISLDGKLVHSSSPKKMRVVLDRPQQKAVFIVRVITEKGVVSQKVY